MSLAEDLGSWYNPHLVCDGCGKLSKRYDEGYGAFHEFYLEGKPYPGWTGGSIGEIWEREDCCPECRKKKI